ncbi:MAG: hypothetical protein FJ368_03095 [Pelagibacterales bacterium]|nr:hypothetical protein [Pelagibacterales bacterium]
MLQNRTIQIVLKLLLRFFGLCLCVFSLVLVLSLITFNSADPSFNSASTQDYVSNWMGSFGSHASDILFQLIGLSSFFLCLILFVVGSKIAGRNSRYNVFPKLIIAPFTILCLSVFFATLPQPSWWDFNSLGGVNGSFILLKLAGFSKITVSIFSLTISLILLSIILEISFSDWVYFFRYSYITFVFLFRKFVNLIMQFTKSDKVLVLRDKKLQNDEEFQDLNLNIKSRRFLEEESEKLNEVEEVEEDKEELKQRLKKTKSKKRVVKSGAGYHIPTPDLLMDRSQENKDKKISKDVVDNQSKMLIKVLEDFGVYGTSLGAKVGPVVTLHEFEPAPGTKASRVIGLSDDIARSMSAVSTRIAVVSGKTSIGIELPNQKREMIFLREMIETKEYSNSQNALPIILGKDISGETMIADLAKMPHLLIAGTTGSGKSVGLNVMILSILFKLRPDECKFIMIDPKMLELSIYDGIPHLLSPVVTEPSKAVIALKWVVAEMEERYRLMSSLAVRNIAGYNEKAEKSIIAGEKMTKKVQTGYDPTNGKPIIEEIEFEAKKLPFIVVIVDEMADLMLVAGKEIENSVQRLAQMARAAGIHLIMATQRPSVDVITGVIKANFPTRISFQVTSRIDSRTILGVQGAEQLLGQGDMIYMSGGAKMTRVHGPFCSDTEIENIVNFIKSQDLSEFENDDKIAFESVSIPSSGDDEDGFGESGGSSDDDLYAKAVMIVRRDKKASISYVQRQLRIGYNRAAILIEKMEEEGIITPPNISGKRMIVEE